LAEAEARLNGADITEVRRAQLLTIVRHVMNTPPDQGKQCVQRLIVTGRGGGRNEPPLGAER
jgi:hypothetical protein